MASTIRLDPSLQRTASRPGRLPRRPEGALTVSTPAAPADRPDLSLRFGLPSLPLVLALALGVLGLASERRGTTRIAFEPTGVVCSVTASLGAIEA